jgi:phosphatidate cytidylyltransferase
VSAFWSRIVVSLALLPVILGILWLGGWWLFAAALVGGLVALHELYSMGRGLRPIVIGGYVGLLLTLLGAQAGDVSWMVGGIFATILVAFVVFGFSDARPSATAAISLTLLGVVWVGGGLATVMLLRQIPENGRLVVFTVLIAVFADDTAAYFVGRTIGRHKMAPTISPGKSWEGFVGGTLAAMAVAFFAMYDQHYLTDLEAVALGAAIAVSSTLGDLFESAIKRDLGVKDSGRILAGHGGVLDRIDSLALAAPVVWLLLLIFIPAAAHH